MQGEVEAVVTGHPVTLDDLGDLLRDLADPWQLTSSVVPYVLDQLAMARMTRATYALLLAVLPATATVIGVVVLRQLPTMAELTGIGLVVAAVALHKEHSHRKEEEGQQCVT